jgi:TolA-binding protein
LARLSREAPAACLLLLVACAGNGDAARRDTDALRAELQALRRENDELARRVEALAGRVEVISTRLARSQEAPAGSAAPAAPLVPPDLAVVRMQPPPAERTPPPLPTGVPIAEPDPERLEALSAAPGRDLGRDAREELRRAREKRGAARAHALEGFAARYPRHPSADNALVEGAAAYGEAGNADAACELARRCAREYPAGDAMSDALERLAWCESRRGAAAGERELLERLVSEFPRTPAAERAGARLATISGRGGETPADPARSP